VQHLIVIIVSKMQCGLVLEKLQFIVSALQLSQNCYSETKNK